MSTKTILAVAVLGLLVALTLYAYMHVPAPVREPSALDIGAMHAEAERILRNG